MVYCYIVLSTDSQGGHDEEAPKLDACCANQVRDLGAGSRLALGYQHFRGGSAH